MCRSMQCTAASLSTAFSACQCYNVHVHVCDELNWHGVHIHVPVHRMLACKQEKRTEQSIHEKRSRYMYIIHVATERTETEICFAPYCTCTVSKLHVYRCMGVHNVLQGCTHVLISPDLGSSSDHVGNEVSVARSIQQHHSPVLCLKLLLTHIHCYTTAPRETALGTLDYMYMYMYMYMYVYIISFMYMYMRPTCTCTCTCN